MGLQNHRASGLVRNKNKYLDYDFYHNKSKEELQDLGIKEVPTPSDFIYHIVTEIKRTGDFKTLL